MGSTARAEGQAPAHPDRTFEILTPSDPTRFYPKFGPLPAVVAVENQTGGWDGVGQSRTLKLSDGSQVTETTKVVEDPRTFEYQLTDFTKLFGNLVSTAYAEWDFDASEEGTRIRWTYTFHAQPGRGWIIALIVKLFWAPYMRKVMVLLVDEVRRVESTPAAK